MDPPEHDRLLEALEEMTASLRVTPQLPQRLRACGVGRLVVADTDVLDLNQSINQSINPSSQPKIGHVISKPS